MFALFYFIIAILALCVVIESIMISIIYRKYSNHIICADAKALARKQMECKKK